MAETVLVTGAGGFAGSHLLHALSTSAPPERLVAWRRPPDGSRPVPAGARRTFGDETRIEWMVVDVLDPDRVAVALAATCPTAIYHCAGAAAVLTSWNSPVPALAVNARGTQHLLAAAAASGLRPRILIPGSALVYRPSDAPLRETDPLGPVSPYGLSKLAQEMLAQQAAAEGFPIVITRSFTHLGPGQDAAYAAASFAGQIARIEAGLDPPVVKVGELDAERDLTDVRDTVQAYRALMAKGAAGRPYNVCSGTAHRISDVLQQLVDRAAAPVTIASEPARQRPRDYRRLIGDPTRLAVETGWKPAIPLENTLDDLLEDARRRVAAQTGRRDGPSDSAPPCRAIP